MGIFVTTPEFAQLNVGFALDGGYASPDETFVTYHAERNIWRRLDIKRMIASFRFVSNMCVI